MADDEAALAEFAFLHGHTREAPGPPVAAAADVPNPNPSPPIDELGDFNSFLGNWLLESWSFGFISANMVQEIAFHGVQDGIQNTCWQSCQNSGAPEPHRIATEISEDIFNLILDFRKLYELIQTW